MIKAVLVSLACLIFAGCSGRLRTAQVSYNRSHNEIVVKRNIVFSKMKRVIGYDDQGHLLYIGQVSDTLKTGLWKYFNNDGLVIAQMEYEGDTVISSTLINRGDMWEQ